MNENERLIWLNGKMVKLSDAKISVLSPMAQFGANVFEGIRCYWNCADMQLYAFRLEDHYRRLSESMKLFRMNTDYTPDFFTKALIDVVQANHYREDIAIRQTVFIDGDSGTWSSTGPVNMFVSPIPKQRKNIPLNNGIRCHISSWLRINDNTLSPRMKCGANYINSRLAQQEAEVCGYDSALFLNSHGFISEGPGACVFIIKNGVLITPSLSDSILESITRNTIIGLAEKELHLVVQERSITRTELYTCDEAFLCGSAAEVTPILEVDGMIIGNGQVGLLTKKLHLIYLKVVSGEMIDYKNWLTPIY